MKEELNVKTKGWQRCLNVSTTKFLKVFPKYSIFFILIVISCCVVEYNVCKGSVNIQGLIPKCYLCFPSGNYAYIDGSRAVIV